MSSMRQSNLAAIAPNLARMGDAALRGREGGKWPYQWLYPGPNSRHVLARGSVATPNYGAPAAVVVEYAVPEGYRFRLTHVMIDGSQVSNWIPGSTQMAFNLHVIASGDRIADWFQDVLTPLGSPVIPWPVQGRLEFQSEDILQWEVSTTKDVGQGDPNFVSCFLIGYIYPNSETDEL